MATKQYLIGGLILLLIAGAILAALDRRYGVRLRRGIWRWTHGSDESIDKLSSSGFIHGRSAKERFTAAIVLWAVITFVGVKWTDVNPFYLILAVFLEVPTLMAGFYLSPFVDRLWEKTDTVLQEVDRLDRGETTLRDELNRATEAVREVIHGADKTPSRDTPLSNAGDDEAGLPLTTEPKTEDPVEKDPKKVVDMFVSGGGRHGRRS